MSKFLYAFDIEWLFSCFAANSEKKKKRGFVFRTQIFKRVCDRDTLLINVVSIDGTHDIKKVMQDLMNDRNVSPNERTFSALVCFSFVQHKSRD